VWKEGANWGQAGMTELQARLVWFLCSSDIPVQRIHVSLIILVYFFQDLGVWLAWLIA